MVKQIWQNRDLQILFVLVIGFYLITSTTPPVIGTNQTNTTTPPPVGGGGGGGYPLQFSPSPSVQVLKNADFSQGLNYWSYHYLSGKTNAVQVINGGVRLNGYDRPAGDDILHFWQTPIKVQGGDTLIVRAKLKTGGLNHYWYSHSGAGCGIDLRAEQDIQNNNWFQWAEIQGPATIEKNQIYYTFKITIPQTVPARNSGDWKKSWYFSEGTPTETVIGGTNNREPGTRWTGKTTPLSRATMWCHIWDSDTTPYAEFTGLEFFVIRNGVSIAG